jgi:hypothetical protein
MDAETGLQIVLVEERLKQQKLHLKTFYGHSLYDHVQCSMAHHAVKTLHF